ncbi:alpha-2-macroglobulin family protein [Blastochloris tepida]|uniref:Alpha-2-macroglobulin n=1 Tax=Blastochloris tepida TaxID=2233851 RepID=A0A348G211_9HYPH|nr:alpha-2-macroglobulin [Blastochloris tepida]BBF93594.1 alpha-2-macroglobulin [Blastochloris tepida]
MRPVVRAALAALLLILPVAALAQTPPLPVPKPVQSAPVQPVMPKELVRQDLAAASLRLEDQLRREGASQIAGRSVQQLRRAAESRLIADPRAALLDASAAVAAEPKDAGAWLAATRAFLAIDPGDGRERFQLLENASIAAYAAYRRATTRNDEAAALTLLGDALTKRQMWRPAMDAYLASLKLVETAENRSAYETLRAEHGFRIVDYTVAADAAAPQVCFQFSEALASRDLASFVTVSGQPNPAVSVSGKELCVDGLAHGERYAIVLRQGLPSTVGEALLKAADYEIYVRDRAPQVRFTGKSYILPRTGQTGIPLVSVNAPRARIAISRIGDRNLISTLHGGGFLTQLEPYEQARIQDEQGVKVWSGTLDLPNELNKDVTAAFPVLEAVGTLEAGVYVMTAKADDGRSAKAEEEDYETLATQWFVVSDLGLSAISGSGGVEVLVRSLASAQPLAGVEVKLVARNNEVLTTATTDKRGIASFAAGFAKGKGGLAPGLAIATDAKGDYAFLDLAQNPLDLTDRGVKGRDAPAALDAFVYAERGVYRSGETVHATALVRDAKGAAAKGVPLTLVVERPDGVEYRRVSVEDQGQGGRSLSVPLVAGVPYGTWRISAFADPKGPAIGETTFLVEDYLPERLELTLEPAQAALKRGEPAEINVAVKYLYGAFATGLPVTGEVVLEAAPRGVLPGFEGYAVGLEDQAFDTVRGDLEIDAVTDARGRASVIAELPETEARRPLQAKITLSVAEPGGRAISRSVMLPVRPAGAAIGVKPLFGEGSLGEGAAATFDVIAAAADGTRIARPRASWTLSRIDTRYQWFRQDGRFEYEAVKQTRRVADGTFDISAEEPARISAPVGGFGRYRLDVKTEGSDAAQTSLLFNVGWGGDATADTPDLLAVTLDKASYRAGETMTVKLDPRFAGTATLAVVGDAVSDLRVITVERAGAAVTVPVKADWGAGAYVVALAHRPMDSAAKLMPGRALGLAWFSIDREARTLPVSLAVPAVMRPRQALSVPVTIGNLTPGEEAFVTIAAVDVGILNLTRYESPSAVGHFLGQRKLAAEVRDLYGFLIDGMQAAKGAIRSGGDMPPAALEGSPPAQAPLARYSGVVKVGPDGTAQVDFDIPAFNGTVRVMAVAWSAGKVGQASADVIVRDPVAVTATLPRFLAIGDTSWLHLALDNIEGAAGTYTVAVEAGGPVKAEPVRRQVRMDARAKREVTVPVTATAPGIATIDVRITGPDLDIAQSYALPVQPGTLAVVRRRVLPLEPGQTLEVTADLGADLVPGTGVVSVAALPLAALDVPALLKALDRYPYGCSEQIVSRALPLLYVSRLEKTEGLALDGDSDARIREAIERVLARQDSSGTFGLWSVGGNDVWLDAFVTDFLTRARERGYNVPKTAFDLALDRLRNFVVNQTEVKPESAAGLAYAVYVLARNGRPVMGDLRYLADTKIGAFDSPLARAQIAAGLGLLGDRGRAERAFGSALVRLAAATDGAEARSDYGSRLRDGAGLLALALESGIPERDLMREAGSVIEKARDATRTTTTQENAWLVLAANAAAKAFEGVELSVAGEAKTGAFYRAMPMAALQGRSIPVTNTGKETIRLVVGVNGNPQTPEPAVSEGYTIDRAYYALDGTKLELRELRQNQRVVVVLTVAEHQEGFARVLLVDRLPAGLEIDSPSLVEGSDVEGLDWLKRDIEPVHTEFRDDRFVAAFERSGKAATYSVAYVARAVSPGRYVHPAAVVEDMYRPEHFGRSGFGTLEVLPAR